MEIDQMSGTPRESAPPTSAPLSSAGVSRREFVRTAAGALSVATVAGTGLGLDVETLFAQTPADSPAEELAVAVVGLGSQGKNLVTKCLRIPGIRFVAVCDIWDMRRQYGAKLLAKYDQEVKTYAEVEEMLSGEPALDAVIVATPDFVHAPHTRACLAAGKHVYCEKEMANTLEAARSMVEAQRASGKLLQIGHQRRSNPLYWHAIKLVEKDRVLGRITHCRAQWHRPRLLERGWPEARAMDAATLARYGYASMQELRNWRWFRKFSGGPMADLGSHQVDVLNWVLKARPRAVQATGGLDYYRDKGCEWADNVLALYEWQTDAGPVRGSYEVLNTSSHGGFYEEFLGDEGSMVVSEDRTKNVFFREVTARRREWEDESETIEKMGREAVELKIGETLTATGEKDPEGQRLLAESKKDVHQLHLENFFGAIRHGTPLTCPPEIAYETAVSVLRANEALAARARVEFSPDEFDV